MGTSRLRFVLLLPLLRLFSVVHSTRQIVFALMKVIPEFAAVLALLGVVFFVYAVVGVWKFAHKFELLQGDSPPAQFDSLSAALLSLFQLLVADSWNDGTRAARSHLRIAPMRARVQ